jgi:tagatose-1,6-bisphosphate aldolase non-catalytic subunit AgaZ/GatZ
MMMKLDQTSLPMTFVKQLVPDAYAIVGESGAVTVEQILLAKIQNVLDDYTDACHMEL